MRERVFLPGLGLGAVAALAMGLGLAPMPYHREPMPSMPKAKRGLRHQIKKYPRARKRDWNFEARVAATNAVPHPNHIHPARNRPPVTSAAIADWHANVELAASRYKGGFL